MKRLCVLGFALAVILGGLASEAVATPYASGNFGMVTVSDSTLSGPGPSSEMSMDAGFGFIAAVGNNFDGLRGEVEVAYRTNDLDQISSIEQSGEITSTAVMGNLLVDLPLSEAVRPFFGGGIGLVNVELSNGGSEDDTVFAYQAIAGIGFPLTHVTTLDLQYRYFASTDPKFEGTEAEYQTHNFFAGLRFDF